MTKSNVLHTIIDEFKHNPNNLIQILSHLQREFGYLPEDVLRDLSQIINIPLAKIFGVITFYSFFSLEPPAKYKIQVCMGTACHVRGAKRNTEFLKDKIDIDFGEKTPNNKFSLESVACLGCCALSPVIKINDDIHGEMTPKKILHTIDNIEAKEQ